MYMVYKDNGKVICGIKLKVALLLLAVSSSLWSPSSLAGDETADLLTECATQLEATTNELEESLTLLERWQNTAEQQANLLADTMTLNDNATALNERLIRQSAEDAERFKTIENSLNEYIATTQRRLLRTSVISGVAGAVVGVLVRSLF
jgi:hypothetical protein